MEPKDLKNSEELNRPANDESELVNEIAEEVKGESAEEVSAELVESVPDTIGIVEETIDDVVPEGREKETVEVEETVIENGETELSIEELAEKANSIAEEAIEEELQVEAEEVLIELAVEEAGAEQTEETSEAEEMAETKTIVEELQAEAEEAFEKMAEEIEEVQTEEMPDAEAIIEGLRSEAEETIAELVVEEVEIDQEEEKPVEEAVIEEPVSIEVEAPEESVPEEPVVEEITVTEEVVQLEEAAIEEPQEQPVEEKTETPEKEAGTESGDTDEDEEISDEDDEGEIPDYNHYSQIELVNALRDIVEKGEGKERHISLIVAAFNQKVKEAATDEKKKFIEEGGVAEDFVPTEDPYENDIAELIKKYRQTKFEQARKFEAEKEENLQKKYAIIEDIKNLLNTEESINRTFQEFRELQKKWYDIGPVPQAKMKDLWDTYHFHVENFYDYIKINKELRDLDLKKNLEAKISICEKSEELLLEPSVIRAFNTLQKYHEQWREIGPVPRDKKDEIWDRFRSVTSQINQKHQEFFDKRKVEQKRNYDAKIVLCEKAEEISAMNLDSHRDWDEKSRELIELQKVWRTIGFAPKRENNKIYDRFRNACDLFFNKRRDFYSQNKESQNKNLQMKMDLCLEAEALKESIDWKNATQQFIEIQRRWKDVGPVSRKQSDVIWKRFRAACDYFFERKSGHFSGIDEGQSENLRLKQELINEVESYVPDTDVSEALKALRDFQRRWTEIGHVPIKEKDAVQNRFRNAINKHFDALKLDNEKRDSLKFRSKIASLTENQKGLSKVRQEREKYMIKLKQLESDLGTLENNIGFFANSKNAQALIADLNLKIEDTKEKIVALKEKIRIIDDLDKSEY
ncbi:MAG: DUF349 domain-containing protein [Prolixibacteraceae bacterium]|nr:DUF349 domain-containing protein [Prolixibacteraceae bacterium]